MSAKKTEAQEEKVVTPKTTTVVKEEPPAVVKIVNPHLTLRINIHGLEVYERTGLRASVMKTGRGWIRARGLSVTDPGVKTENTPEAGAEVEHEGVKVQADLRIITFSEACIAESGKTVIVPAPRGPKANATEGKEGNAGADDGAKKPAKTKKSTKAEAKAEAKEDDVPADW